MRAFVVRLAASKCRILRPLDRFGRGADLIASTLSLAEITQRLAHFGTTAEVIILGNVDAGTFPLSDIERQQNASVLRCVADHVEGALDRIAGAENVVGIDDARR